jgi:hypothetical protein
MSVGSIQAVISAWRSFGRWSGASGSWNSIFERQRDSPSAWNRAGEKASSVSTALDLETYAEEQIRGLVRQIFLSGWPKPTRQVVFCAVDEDTNISELCTRVATALAEEVPSDVCLVGGGETTLIHDSSSQVRRAGFRRSSGQISSNLWLVPQEVLRDSARDSGDALCRQLETLRQEFEFSVIQGAAVNMHPRAAILGRACDGMVLTLEAEITRRVAAQRAKELLSAAGVNLLGTILCNRKFPIPDAIYRRV